MTSRELRTRRRAEERKASKLARKQLAVAQPNEIQPAAPSLPTPPLPEIGEIGFVPQNASALSRRAETNRRNARHSTGPRTMDGKLASSRNSTKHGLTSGQIIIAGEDPAAFDALLAAFFAEHQPANIIEELLVQEMAQSHWLGQRAIRLQNDCFSAEGVDTKRLALFLRYQTTHQRAFHKALAVLLALKKTRRQEEIGFVSQNKPPRPAASASSIGFVSQNAHEPPRIAPSMPSPNKLPPMFSTMVQE
ncbi:MAG TPA: hypothetical protein VGL97_12955 [Bryobacteraceae bacterium]|jgi:hypothetical protein